MIKYIDLFAGVGGIRLGKPSSIYERDKVRMRTFK